MTNYTLEDVAKQPEHIQQRIKQLEYELKVFLETTEDYVPDGKKRSTHHTKRIDIHRRIANLLKCGYEHPAQNPESQAKKRAKNMELYGFPQGNLKAINASKLAKGYKSVFGPNAQAKQDAKRAKTVAKMLATKEERGSQIGAGKKAAETKRINGTISEAAKKANATRKLKYPKGACDWHKHVERMTAEYGSMKEYYHQRALKAAANHDYQADNEKKRAKFNGKAQNIDKIKDTCNKRYGYDWPCMLPHVRSRAKAYSKLNQKYQHTLETIFNIQIEHDKMVGSQDYDLAYSNLLIELNPTVSHSCTHSYAELTGKTVTSNDYPHDIWYHVNKQQNAIQHGYRCIQKFDWDDSKKFFELIRSIIATDTLPKFYARKCNIVELEQKVAKAFQEQYHLQGSVWSQPICLGLIDMQTNELVQVMTFGKTRHGRKSNTNDYELLRLCSANCIVVGGAQRLFKYFVEHWQPQTIVSYCDLSKFTGTIYEQLGFELKRISPSLRYVRYKNKDKRLPYIVSSALLRMHGADRLLGTNYGKGTSNHDIMLAHGYVGVYDCGQATYVWQSDKN